MKKLILILLTLTTVNVAFAKKKSPVAKRPLVLWLHGCLQTPEQFITQSKIEEITSEVNPVILAPEQSIFANPVKCWNWFLPSLQDNSEFMASVVGQIQDLISQGIVDEERIYVGGFSAGSVLSTHFAVCYPDVFKGALLHSGAPYKFVQNLFTLGNEDDLAQAAYDCGDRNQKTKLNNVIIFSGTHDPVSTARDNELVLKQVLGFYDLLDDQELNDSAVEDVTVLTTDRPKDKITDFKMHTGAHVRFVSIHKMRHQYSGGDKNSLATSPDTLSATQAFLGWTLNFTK
ncbi:MAG: PHB depolymerase family esterase [Pseudobdellovibrio sp.]|nr:PHB depolymerase family esterase [Pseudobdellovibrio sp.]